MNQMKKRLTIIKLAISMTDIETIQLQILKLTPIKTDNEIQKILSLLQAGNYAQAQALITKYIDFAPQEVVQRTSQPSPHDNLFTLTEEDEEEYIMSEEEQAIIDEFQLILDSNHKNNSTSEEDFNMEIDINEFTPLKKSKTDKTIKEPSTINFDSLLKVEAKDVLVNNIDLDISNTPKETIKEIIIKEKTKDTFFDTPTENINSPQEDTFFNTIEEELVEEIEVPLATNIPQEEIATNNTNTDVDTLHYSAIPDIAQRLINMKYKYPLIQKIHTTHGTVDTLLNKISTEEYSEEEIEEMLKHIQKLIEKSQYTEAAQLLLICGATESKYAQFSLARELYIGSVLRKNIHESFALMNTLAMDDYPEALCDLGQFYEHGIGTTPNPIKAEGLYKEAVNLGIIRAKKHYNRLKKSNKSFFKKPSSL